MRATPRAHWQIDDLQTCHILNACNMTIPNIITTSNTL